MIVSSGLTPGSHQERARHNLVRPGSDADDRDHDRAKKPVSKATGVVTSRREPHGSQAWLDIKSAVAKSIALHLEPPMRAKSRV